jgi:hypothetical protein
LITSNPTSTCLSTVARMASLTSPSDTSLPVACDRHRAARKRFVYGTSEPDPRCDAKRPHKTARRAHHLTVEVAACSYPGLESLPGAVDGAARGLSSSPLCLPSEPRGAASVRPPGGPS